MKKGAETVDREPHDRSRLIRIGIFVAGLGSLAALVTMVLTGLERVRMGHGLDGYRTVWMVEVNWIGFLVFLAVLLVAIAAGAWFRYREWRELQELRARYGTQKPGG
jgi:uncharacterized membrane protein YcjF (UPF0283 family)